MIDYICGILSEKYRNNIITIDVYGIGYSVFATHYVFSKLPDVGNKIKLYIVENISGIYGGIVTLYGFSSIEERSLYLLIKKEVPGIGAKKSIEYIDRIINSLYEFKDSILTKDYLSLKKMGFTKKTSDKLISALKDKLQSVSLFNRKKNNFSKYKKRDSEIIIEAINGLIALGYKKNKAKIAVDNAYEHISDKNINLENLLKQSLLYI
ncbi:MAG: hypothetical protein LBL53_01260 [Endomicrobium sp.]|jgi:Holliday junction DNA helicase RuvA|nr:hypothetical protein [Endomicrobium sp.]